MAGADDLLHRIVQQHRDAVGGVDNKGQAAFIGDEPVHVVVPLPIQPLARISGGRNADIVLMHLMGDDHTVDVRTDGGAEAPEIFPDAGRVIPLTEPQVQRIKGRGADAPKPGGEAVDCPQPLRTVEGHAGACHAFK